MLRHQWRRGYSGWHWAVWFLRLSPPSPQKGTPQFGCIPLPVVTQLEICSPQPGVLMWGGEALSSLSATVELLFGKHLLLLVEGTSAAPRPRGQWTVSVDGCGRSRFSSPNSPFPWVCPAEPKRRAPAFLRRVRRRLLETGRGRRPSSKAQKARSQGSETRLPSSKYKQRWDSSHC